jgi:Arc/MetJ-type ribon-helix-helix transcriptional regulator
MKLSVSLTEEDIRFLDEYREASQLPSRSSAVQRAIALLRESRLEDAYAAAWEEWDHSGDAETWDAVSADGLIDEER